MRTKSTITIAVSGLLWLATGFQAHAQYHDSRVLEKSFDQMDMFFTPGSVNPYGFDGFGPVAPGLIDNPFLNVIINPAFAGLDSVGSSSGYLDFRQSRNSQPVYDYYCCPYLYDTARSDLSIARYPYPYYPQQQTVAPEPLFAAAYQMRPIKPLAVGFSYQLLFRDSDYFAVPADIYRSSATADFANNPLTDNNTIPITDISGGSNSMRTVGHQASANVATTSGPLTIGARFATTIFDRNGSVGNQNFWSNQTQQVSSSLWRNDENRSVDYHHFDGSIGLLYHFTSRTIIGLSGGLLSGSADQVLVRSDTSFYSDGQPANQENFSTYLRGGSASQQWDHDGSTNWIGFNARTALSDRASATVLYKLEQRDIDLAIASTVRDTSNSEYRYMNESFVSSSSGYSSLQDSRTGSGNTEGTSHRAAVMAHWQIDRKTQLSLGGDVNSRLSKTNTVENVSAHLLSFYEHSYDNNVNVNEFASDEQKELHWRFRTRTTTLSFPIHVRTSISSKARLEFGINRRLVLWNIEDETTALFDFRETVNNGTSSRRENFGERFSEPLSRESEVRTTVLAGLTLSPTPNIDIRMLVAPEYRRRYDDTDVDLRWWIGLGLRP